MSFFSKITDKLRAEPDVAITRDGDEGYVEIDTDGAKEAKAKIIVKPYTLDDFSDVKDILDDLREGYTIALINIRPLRNKDMLELKRVVNKLKKTCDAIEGDIAGFGDDWIAIVPSFAKIHREKGTKEVKATEE